FLADNFGFWGDVQVDDEQTARLQRSFQRVLEGKGVDSKSLYQKDNEFAGTIKRVMSECAQVGWMSGGHSDGYVPCFAIGVGAEQIHGRIDNTEIPLAMAKAAGWQVR
ncbi:MAG TPA: alkaline phosphatase, partial [Prevotellaceae bacterium]|nr:alkaline phosphatase [Prevotellaceae bacterium]